MAFANPISNLQTVGVPVQYNQFAGQTNGMPVQYGEFNLMPAGQLNMSIGGINSVFTGNQMMGNPQMMQLGMQSPYPSNPYNLFASRTTMLPNMNWGMGFNMPQFNFGQYWQAGSSNQEQAPKKSESADKKEKQADDGDGAIKTDAETLEALKKLGYNEEKGRKLAQVAMKNCAGKSYGKCATWVKKDIQEAGLGKYKSGHGKDIDNAYADNPNFKLVDAKNLNWKKLPPGCVQVYEAGEAGYHRIYGHTQIVGTDGKGYSDCAIRNVKQGTHILIPV